MDTHECNGGTLQSQSLSKLQIVSIMSVIPLKVTEPRRVCQVLVNDNDTDHRTIHAKTIHQGCYQIVLYYEKMKEVEEHDWSLAGWLVESLARALSEHPIVAGRLQRRDDTARLEIVSNDSGIRLLEARYPTRLSEFLELNGKGQLAEADLVFWKEIDAQCPEFSPLFYVQVTSFECGGYSIGISCSILLTEVLVVENFLNKWAQIHNMLLQNEDTETPIFYHPRLENPESLPPHIISRTKTKHGPQSVKAFKITSAGDVINFSKEMWRELALLCVEDAEQKLDIKMGSEFSLVVKESTETIKVESCSRSGYNTSTVLKNGILGVTWNDFGVNEVAFQEGNKPVHVSCWIGSVADGCVILMAMPYPHGNACVVIVVSHPLSET